MKQTGDLTVVKTFLCSAVLDDISKLSPFKTIVLLWSVLLSFVVFVTTLQSLASLVVWKRTECRRLSLAALLTFNARLNAPHVYLKLGLGDSPFI